MVQEKKKTTKKPTNCNIIPAIIKSNFHLYQNDSETGYNFHKYYFLNKKNR